MREGDNKGSRKDPGRAVTIVFALYPEVTWEDQQRNKQKAFVMSPSLVKFLNCFARTINLGKQQVWKKNRKEICKVMRTFITEFTETLFIKRTQLITAYIYHRPGTNPRILCVQILSSHPCEVGFSISPFCKEN